MSTSVSKQCLVLSRRCPVQCKGMLGPLGPVGQTSIRLTVRVRVDLVELVLTPYISMVVAVVAKLVVSVAVWSVTFPA